MTRTPIISVAEDDVLTASVDVLVLKYAGDLFGVAGAAAKRLGSLWPPGTHLNDGDHTLLATKGRISPARVLYVGVSQLATLGYDGIGALASRSLSILQAELPNARHVAMTLHGANYGLDDVACFLAELDGISEALVAGAYPPALERITFYERKPSRAQVLRGALARALAAKEATLPPAQDDVTHGGVARVVNTAMRTTAPVSSLGRDEKPVVFVAMPFSGDMEDVFYFGIQEVVHRHGCLCVRLDHEAFTGDILQNILMRIRECDLVVADMTGANPNVYLEVGYAWGVQRRVLLLCHADGRLGFDVAGHKAVIYKSIRNLAEQLASQLQALLPVK